MRIGVVYRSVLVLVLVVAAALTLRFGAGKGSDGRKGIEVVVPDLTVEEINLVRTGVAECLTRVGFDFSAPEPWLATRWEDLGKGRWHFHLRPDVVFHTGEALDAEAVVAGMRWYRRRPRGRDLEHLLEVRAAGPRILEIRAASPTLPVPGYLGRVPVVHPRSFDAEGNLTVPVGTGPFRAVSFEPEKGAYLVKNEHYWSGSPRLDELRVRVVKDPSTRLLLLETGEAQWARMVPRHEVARLAREGYGVHRSRYLYNVYLVFNCTVSPGSDPAVRRAVAFALDRTRIASTAFEGTAEPAVSVFPRNLSFVPGDLLFCRHDPAESERILDDAGWSRPPGGRWRARAGRDLALTLLTASEGLRPAWPAAAELIRQDLTRVGIRVDVRVLEPGVWDDRVRSGRFQVTVRGRVPAWWPDPLGYFRLDLHSTCGNNVCRFRSPRFDQIVDAGVAAQDAAARKAAVAEAQRILAQEMPLVPLCHDIGRETFVVRTSVLNAATHHTLTYSYPGPRTDIKEETR